MKTQRLLSILILLALILGGGWIWLNRIPDTAAQARPSLPLRDHPAPDFTLNALDGAPLTLSSLRGQAVVLNFWATWCPPCQAEMPELQAAHQRYGESGLVVLGVNQAEAPDVVQSFLETRGLDFPVVLDSRGIASQLYQVNSLPSTFFIDRSGVIRGVVIGQMNAATLKQQLKNIYP